MRPGVLQVFSGSTSTTYRETDLGVPCLHVNDLQLDLGSGIVLRLLYAGDLQVYIQTSTELFHDGLTRFTEAARVVVEWASRNSLTLNTKNTRAIVFGSSHTVGLFDSLYYAGINIAEGKTVKFVSDIKSLGVIIDNTLSIEAPNQSGGKESQLCSGIDSVTVCLN